MSGTRILIYDCTLRDGQQMQGVDWGVADKQAIARELDAFGVDVIEGGWPGANPIDDGFFAAPPRLKNARLSAFGMTRRAGRSASNDPGLVAVFAARTPVVTLVGKTWDYHATVALGVEPEENLAMIRDSMAEAVRRAETAMFDAEHFFDGFARNPTYALAALRAAHQAGAAWLVLCDTNGGTLPHEVEATVHAVRAALPGAKLGFHGHNDTGNATANTLAAVRAGCTQVQGTLNGIGERCGNADLIQIIPNLMLKLGLETNIPPANLRQLTRLSRFLDERLNRAPARGAPFVGESAFAHKGGLHVSAVARDPATYEHIPPESVGNHRHIVVSDQAGRANILQRLRDVGIQIADDDRRVARILEQVKAREFSGYAYDAADASFELLARRVMGTVPDFFTLESFRVLVERRAPDAPSLAEATVKLTVAGERTLTVAEGHGPVDALDGALRRALAPFFPALARMQLTDYRVRILTPEKASAAVTRVIIESGDDTGATWSTVGVSDNVIEASFLALSDAITWNLLREEGAARAAA